MKQALALFWESIKDFWDELFTMVQVNLLWVGLSLLPIVLSLSATWLMPPEVLWVGIIISLILAPAATAGLNLFANEMAHERRASPSVFWQGFREYFWQALGIGIISLLLLALIVSNYLFYGRFEPIWANWVRGAWIVVALFWTAIQLYLYPLFMEQVPKNILLPFRNSVFMVLASPIVAGTALVLTLLTLGLSLGLAFPLLIGAFSFIALYTNKLTLAKLRDFKRLHESTSDESEGE